MLGQRKSGILMPLFSLPSRYGVGDLGGEAYSFCNFLSASGQSLWQILPLTITGRSGGNSPYSSISAFAGNPLNISPKALGEEGLISGETLEDTPTFETGKVDYEGAARFRTTLFRKAFLRFREKPYPEEYERFCADNGYWLDDFALFVVLKDRFHGRQWQKWPEGFRDRDIYTMKSATKELRCETDYQKFLQYEFDRQWKSLHGYCMEKGIGIIGDIPIYVDCDSADVWSNRSIFQLDGGGNPTAVSGVPPDYFSSTGQRWGNPLYDWEALARSNFLWWTRRIARWADMYDLLRMDHFRGFVAYWSIPAHDATAERGHWEKAPWKSFLDRLKYLFPNITIVAENLGTITPEVDTAMKEFGLPGMLVLQFAFDGDMNGNRHIPHNHGPNNIVYTGTHDNNTARGWFEEEASAEQKSILDLYSGFQTSGENVSRKLIRMAMGSCAKICITPMQDILELGGAGRINTPSSMEGNWKWMAKPDYSAGDIAGKLYGLTGLFGRL